MAGNVTMNPERLKPGEVRITVLKPKKKKRASPQTAASVFGGALGKTRDAINKRKNRARRAADGTIRREQ